MRSSSVGYKSAFGLYLLQRLWPSIFAREAHYAALQVYCCNMLLSLQCRKMTGNFSLFLIMLQTRISDGLLPQLQLIGRL